MQSIIYSCIAYVGVLAHAGTPEIINSSPDCPRQAKDSSMDICAKRAIAQMTLRIPRTLHSSSLINWPVP